jgi:hypothetical protein
MSEIPPEEHLHLVDSFAYGWCKLNLIFEQEPRGEMPFVAAPLHRLWRTELSGWLVQNRRFLGLSMAVSHGFHGVTLGALHVVTQGQHPQINPLAILGYVF